MLVLSRIPGESILIGEDGPEQIKIVVLQVRGDKVRVGIEASRDVPIHREEVAEKIRNKKEAEATV